MRIVVAMSGGVDSSVAAGLLAEAGHEVVGVSMQLYDNSRGFGTCCTIDDLHDARRVAAHLGFPHYIVNFESHFHRHVQQNFVDEYARGRTPIPCAHCNSEVKFSELLTRAGGYGASHLATGHYARIVTSDDGRVHLYRGRDRAKDQSYFLFSLTQAQLAQALFPVGDLAKDDVRRAAASMGLDVASKPDSQEICFVPDDDYAGFLERESPALATSGAVVDQHGHTMGSHGGVHRFTIGQRKGLGLSAGVPLYVVNIDATRQEVTVGPREALDRTGFTVSRVNWIAGTAPAGCITAQVQIRHRHQAAAARVSAIDDGRTEVTFESPQSAITPGQAAVFYAGDEVLGGGWID
ncbi:MAG: tRNA 2-thiouridine(34) synthase MnmA [Acidobacteria bacterium]|nr:tRNA 2-thiouridine(34) synthase MnmA [Acidobacteriota bacterium]